ncbi:hypothetical protein AcV7_009223 [Taiwanofungus camphoratus]|nr:hypothetical protein AcV7_009223 [Antrodia cinnamomea]
MDFLFDRPASIPCSPSFHSNIEDDTVLLSESLWNSLNLPSPAKDDIAICISRYSPCTSTNSSTLSTLVCRAALDTEAPGVAVPSRWLEDHHNIFSRNDFGQASTEPTHSVTVTHPVVLSEVILSAVSSDSYAIALSYRTELENWFFERHTILRQGSLYSFTANDLGVFEERYSNKQSYKYQLVVAAPVLQGYVGRGVTRFYVTSATPSNFLANPSNLPLDDALETDTRSESDLEELQKERIEIDEDFLAGSVLLSMPGASHMTHNGDGDPHHIQDVGEGSSLDKFQISSLEWSCKAEPLLHPISARLDDCTVYVRTSDLSRIGVLNGDWAVVRSDHGNSCRLVRIYVNDDVVEVSGTVSASPQLLHNIVAGSLMLSIPHVLLRSSPFGSRSPTIPMARSITIARVASPFSTDRAYQPLFLRALQDYFQGATRLVKPGDVIAVKIDSDETQHLNDQDLNADASDNDEPDPADFRSPKSHDNANELVYFIVTNIEHNVLSNHGDASSVDMYVGSTVGELGCWVDPTITRIIQTGIEHSRVPDTAAYIGIKKSPVLTVTYEQSFSLLAPDSAYGKLFALSSAALNRHAVDYHLQLSILLKGPFGVGKYTTASCVARRLGIHLFEVSCYDILGENDAKTEGTLRARFERAASCSPCILLLRHIDALSQTTQGLEPGKDPSVADTLRECMTSLQQSWALTSFPILVVATTSNPDRVPPRVLSYFKHEITFEAPSESERYDILVSLLSDDLLGPDVSLRDLAVQTAALVAADLVTLVHRARSASIKRAMRNMDHGEIDLFRAGIPLLAADFDIALADSRASYSDSIGAPKIPSVSWDDVGGLAHVKADILDTIQLPLEHPEMFADGLKKRSGILLYGPPGTGKTLLAKAVATSFALNFFSVKGPELLNMYIGESEANVRRVFQRARDARPCVVFFDELDSVAPKRGNHGDSGGVMDRIVSQILAELDGLSSGKSGADVFVIGATNRPDLLDPALLRPGRFDRMLYLGVSDTHAAQLNILQALTRKFRLHPDLRLDEVAEQCPFHYTGADFYALCADALLKAMSRKAKELEATIDGLNKSPHDLQHPYPLTPQYYLAELATSAETEVLVSQEDFDFALRELVPSVSQAEMDHYARIQQRFSPTTINGSS